MTDYDAARQVYDRIRQGDVCPAEAMRGLSKDARRLVELAMEAHRVAEKDVTGNHPNPYAHLDERQLGLADQFEQVAGIDGADLKDLLDDASDLPNTDKAALAQAWGGPEAAAEYHDQPADTDEMTEVDDDRPTADTYEQMAQRIDRGADRLDYEADHAAEVLADRMGGDRVDPNEWAAEKRRAAEAARGYAAGLRADAGNDTPAEAGWERLRQADLVAVSTDSGGTLVDGRRLDEARAQSDSVFDADARKAWEEGTTCSQEKARQVEATGLFTYVDETIDGIKQVPFWRLDGPVDGTRQTEEEGN